MWYFVGLQTRYKPGRNLDNRSQEGVTLPRVGEIFTIEDLELPVLLDEREDADRIIFVGGTDDGSAHARCLRRGYMLWSEAT